jgi:hypothetical protein
MAVNDGLHGQTDRPDAVKVFVLHGHSTATRCYAWFHADGDPQKPRRVAVLHHGPVDSPHSAVQAVISGEYQGRPRASAAVFRANDTQILMVKHSREDGTTY